MVTFKTPFHEEKGKKKGCKTLKLNEGKRKGGTTPTLRDKDYRA